MATGNANHAGIKTKPTSREAAFAAYDALPAPLRHALAEAIVDWRSQEILANVRRGRSIASLVASIRAADQQVFDIARSSAAWGPGHPQCSGPRATELGL